MNIKSLQTFLIAANKAGYASGSESLWKKEKDGSTTITFFKRDFSMHDNFFGGEPYGGRLVVFYKNKPAWIMSYYGSVANTYQNVDKLYFFLRESLRRMPKDLPLRGPSEFKDNSFTYQMYVKGGITNYCGEERIFSGKQKVYEATFVGGLVDQRQGV